MRDLSLSHVNALIVGRRRSCSVAYGSLDFQSEIEPTSLALQGGFLTTEPVAKSPQWTTLHQTQQKILRSISLSLHFLMKSLANHNLIENGELKIMAPRSMHSSLFPQKNVCQVPSLAACFVVVHQVVVPGGDVEARTEGAVHFHGAGVPVVQGIGIGV